jgi:signal transduction histidine kinase
VEDDKRTASILSSIRGMMKLEKKEKEKVNLNEMIDELIIIYSGEAIKRQIKLDASLNPEPVYILADRTQIQQVIMNFILNAFLAMDKVSQNDRTVSITELTDNEYVTVSVRDKGRGIEDAIMDKIFKPFVTTRKEGTGIGLAISHSIIQDHQGTIWAENMPDGGAKFSFRLKTI